MKADDVDPSVFLESVATIGLTSALVVFFVWISWKREERLSARVTELEHQLTTTIIAALEANTKALADVGEALRDLRDEIHRIDNQVTKVANDLNNRPCAMNSKKLLTHLGLTEDEIEHRERK